MKKIFQVLTIAISCVAVTAQAKAILTPSKGKEICLKRIYDNDHMTRNPNQLVSSMYVKLFVNEAFSEGFEAKVVGQHAGKLYGNNPGCNTKADGSVNCYVECDGGSFDLKESPRFANAVNWSVRKDYYFPLFLNRWDDEIEQNTETIKFLSEDKDNNIFRLYPADVKECNDMIERVGNPEPAGC